MIKTLHKRDSYSPNFHNLLNIIFDYNIYTPKFEKYKYKIISLNNETLLITLTLLI